MLKWANESLLIFFNGIIIGRLCNVRKSDKDILIKLALLFGAYWLLKYIFTSTKQAGIHGLPGAKRKITQYFEENGKDPIVEEMRQYDRNEIQSIIDLIIKARMRDELTMPLFKSLKNTEVNGELRDDQWRILVQFINPKDLLILHVIKKKTNEIPEEAIKKATIRLRKWKSRKD